MIVTYQSCTTVPHGAMGIDQRLRSDLEMCFGRGMDIGGGAVRGNRGVAAKQQPTCFTRESDAGLDFQCLQHRA